MLQNQTIAPQEPCLLRSCPGRRRRRRWTDRRQLNRSRGRRGLFPGQSGRRSRPGHGL